MKFVTILSKLFEESIKVKIVSFFCLTAKSETQFISLLIYYFTSLGRTIIFLYYKSKLMQVVYLCIQAILVHTSHITSQSIIVICCYGNQQQVFCKKKINRNYHVQANITSRPSQYKDHLVYIRVMQLISDILSVSNSTGLSNKGC